MKVYVAGHRGMVGGAILRRLQTQGLETVTRTHAELDLTDQAAVRGFMQSERPDAQADRLRQKRAVHGQA